MLNREKVSEIFPQNPSLPQIDISKLTGVARSSVGFILRQYKGTRCIERKAGSEKRKDIQINIKQNQSLAP